MNKKLFLSLFFIFSFFFSSVSSSTALDKLSFNSKLDNFTLSKTDKPKYVPDEVLIKFKQDRVNLEKYGIMSFFRELGLRSSHNLNKNDTLKTGNIVVYKIQNGRSVEEVIKDLQSDPNVEFAQPNYYSFKSDLGTNDTYKNNLWGLDNFGQTINFDNGGSTVGTSGADIDIVRAWSVDVGTSDVIVAVIDSGVGYSHPDLIGNMWDGSSCVDEVGTPIIGGCLHGYNFYTNSNDPTPNTSSHGTHIAGVIAGVINNSLGIAGVSSKAKIMALNCEDEEGYFDTACIIKSIDFAIQNNAKVINASYASSSYSALEYEAIDRLKSAGGILIAAAGNEGQDNDLVSSYPSDYNLDNIISVAATNNLDELTSFSNYGLTSVDVGAPGEDIYSTVIYRQNYFEDFSSTNPDPDSYWAIGSLSNGASVLIGDSNVDTGNYLDNSDYYITSNTIDLSPSFGSPLATFNFTGVCDDAGTTNPDNSPALDYMSLEISNDGIGFTQVASWNELSMSSLQDSSCSFGVCGNEFSVTLDSAYLNTNFKYRFRWVTDASLNTDLGCYMYNIQVLDYPEDATNAEYDFMDGTSVAAPYVAGLASYLWSVNPLATYTQVVQSILENGDDVASLLGKTTTGKRINAYNSVLAINELGEDPTPTPTEDPTPTPTEDPTPTPTEDPTPTPTEDPTPTPTEDPTPTPTEDPTPTPTVNQTVVHSQSSPPGRPPCTDIAPIYGPDIFEIRTDKGKVTLFYTSTPPKTNEYAFLYGFQKGDERFGAIGPVINNNEGVQNYTIYDLDPTKTYYFKVAAINKCDISDWSSWVPAQANKKKTIYKYRIIIKNKIKSLVEILK